MRILLFPPAQQFPRRYSIQLWLIRIYCHIWQVFPNAAPMLGQLEKPYRHVISYLFYT